MEGRRDGGIMEDGRGEEDAGGGEERWKRDGGWNSMR